MAAPYALVATPLACHRCNGQSPMQIKVLLACAAKCAAVVAAALATTTVGLAYGVLW
ncbi:hypothetical protein [uncultured Ferrimonas sp.]|uniref:hypothetical protein n=1 Tax=uncultured Ferrimonas sp. TaxID=432640 RepID=UPI0026341AF2|nr:hypothetical protein [uncultured Ferrimonas sp.]